MEGETVLLLENKFTYYIQHRDGPPCTVRTEKQVMIRKHSRVWLNI